MKTERKAKNIIKKRFGNCVVQEKAHYKGNNLQYLCLCDCKAEFTTSGQQLRSGLILACPDCRSCKRKEALDAERLKRLESIDVNATKYTLMNPAKDKIIKGRNGIHAYFDKTKARIAARVIGNAIAVPLSEAKIICP